MTTIRTQLWNLEDARRWRFEPTPLIPDTNVQQAIERAATIPPTISATPVSVASSPYSVLPTDVVLYVDTSTGPVSIVLGPSASRNGLSIEILDISGNAATNRNTHI